MDIKISQFPTLSTAPYGGFAPIVQNDENYIIPISAFTNNVTFGDIIDLISSDPDAVKDALELNVSEDEIFENVDFITSTVAPSSYTDLYDLNLSVGVWKINAVFNMKTTALSGTTPVTRSRFSVISGNALATGQRKICPHQGTMTNYTYIDITNVNNDLSISPINVSPNFGLGSHEFDLIVVVTFPAVIRWSVSHTATPSAPTIGKFVLESKKKI